MSKPNENEARHKNRTAQLHRKSGRRRQIGFESNIAFSVERGDTLESMKENQTLPLLPDRREMMRAFHDKNAEYDGVFYVAVHTTGIFCRPSCPSQPKPENVEFFGSVRDCWFAGYRPCKRCHPLEANGAPPQWAATLMQRAESSSDARIKAADLRELGVTPERAGAGSTSITA